MLQIDRHQSLPGMGVPNTTPHPQATQPINFTFCFRFRLMSDSENDDLEGMMTLASLADKLVIAYLQVQ